MPDIHDRQIVQPEPERQIAAPRPAVDWFAALLDPRAMEAAKMLAASGLVPKAFVNKPHDILIAGAMGARLGLDIFSALAGIAAINGRPTVWGDVQLAVCQQHPEWGDMEESEEGEWPDTVRHCTVTRRGKKPCTESFGMEDARHSGLAKKEGPWQQYPKRMCAQRARSWALRAAFADVLAGFDSREEAEDAALVEVQGTVLPEPKAPRSRAAKIEPPAAAPVVGAPIEPGMPVQQEPGQQALPTVAPEQVKPPEQAPAKPAAEAPKAEGSPTYQAMRAEFIANHDAGGTRKDAALGALKFMMFKNVKEMLPKDDELILAFVKKMRELGGAGG